MKAKKGYSGLNSFAISLPFKKQDLLKLNGRDAQMRQINDLFDSGSDEKARLLLRKTLDEMLRGLDQLSVASGKSDEDYDEMGSKAAASLDNALRI